MAGETVTMLAELGLRLEDAGAINFTTAFKLKALDRAQLQLANMLHNAYLTDLEVLEEGLDWSGIESTGYDITGLSSDPVLRGGQGILKVAVSVAGDGDYVWATKIDLHKIKRVENTFLVGSDANPLWYVFKSYIFVSITTDYTALDGKVLYLKFPTEITATNVDPTLNVSLHPLIVSLAEGMCWGMDGKLDRRNTVMKDALDQIKALNERYTPAEGVGTQNYREGRR